MRGGIGRRQFWVLNVPPLVGTGMALVPDTKPKTKGSKMIVKLRITKEDVNEYDGRKGHVVQKILICQDEAPKGMRNTIDVVVDKEDEIKLGKVPHVGKLLEFNVRDIFPVFGGRVKFSGAVVSVQ